MRRGLVGLLLVCASVGLAAQSPSLAARAWTIRYSAGLPKHPTALTGMAGWYVDLPPAPGSLHYLTTPQKTPIVAGQLLTLSVQIVTTGLPIFAYDTEPQNTCVVPPATVRAYLEDKDFAAHPSDDFTRWWSNPIAIELRDGAYTASTPIALGAWSSVYGTWNQDYQAQWAYALAHPAAVGMTFGGGCFFGHGVYVQGGTARFILTSYTIQ